MIELFAPGIATKDQRFAFLSRGLAVRSLFLILMLGWSAWVHAADVSEPHILVATPELRDSLYGSSILVVKPIGGDRHIGFIVNRPTSTKLGTLFPEDGPSQKIVDPVYLGGPVDTQVLFALVERPESPGGNSIEVLPGLYVAVDGPIVDRIIEAGGDRARFVAGLVVWQPGELASEIGKGAWYVVEPDATLVMRKPEGLWEDLVSRSRARRLAI
jgi:putative transcriptional regulator